jgi:drug/metabolite transporter (DMT)-like permease
MPIANASAILQALPLAVTMGAALVLGEKVGWRRWAAIIIGLLGVLYIVRPGTDGFNAWSLLVVVCVVFAAARDLFTRVADHTIPAAFMSLATAGLITLAGLVLIVPYGGWTPMSMKSLLQLAAAAVFILFGYQYVILSMRSGEIGFVAPFRYTSLIWALVLGYFVFGDVPNQYMLIGASIVVASGVYTFHRESVLARGK